MKILIVDDEALIRRSLSRVFLQQGWEVFTAGESQLAQEIWLAQDPDIVFLDIIMPGQSGPELLKQMRETRAKVVMMSAFADNFEIEDRVSTFIAKPFDNIFDLVDVAKRLAS